MFEIAYIFFWRLSPQFRSNRFYLVVDNDTLGAWHHYEIYWLYLACLDRIRGMGTFWLIGCCGNTMNN